MKNNIPVPDYALEVLAVLETNGFEAYFAGGCIRDRLMSKEPKDWDIATSAKPAEVIGAFKDYKVIPTGIKHGTVSVVTGGGLVEITTFRVDGKYSDNRRPDSVSFTRSLKEDLSRRDFTVNALAYNPRTGIEDYFDGVADMENMLIKCVGDPEARFGEDALRIMRGARFACELGFTVEKKTLDAMKHLRGLLGKIAAERISAELSRALTGPAFAIFFMEAPEILASAIPALECYIGRGREYERLLQAVSAAPPDLVTRLALLFPDADTAVNALTTLRYDNRTISQTAALLRFNSEPVLPDEKNVKRWLNKTGVEGFRRILDMRAALAAADGDDAGYLKQTRKILEQVLAEGQCYSLKQLAVNGADLINAGIAEGTGIGAMLEFLLERVMDGGLENEKSGLLKAALDKAAHN